MFLDCGITYSVKPYNIIGIQSPQQYHAATAVQNDYIDMMKITVITTDIIGIATVFTKSAANTVN